MMHTPKTVVFDLGKVLLDFDYSITARKVAAASKVKGDPMRFFTSQSALLLRYETGLLTSDEFYGAVCAETGYCGSIEQFGDCFGDIFSEIVPMVKLQADLRSRGIPTYIFSNTNDFAVRHIRRAFPFFANFDGYVLSFEHGAMKPDPKLYEVLERISGSQGPDILYLDDRPENIQTGSKRGWQVVLQESPERSIAAVHRLGLLNSHPVPARGSP